MAFEALPSRLLAVTDNDVIKTRLVEGPGLDELEQPGLVFRPTRLQSNCREVFGGEDTGRNAINVGFDRLGERLLDQFVGFLERL